MALPFANPAFFAAHAGNAYNQYKNPQSFNYGGPGAGGTPPGSAAGGMGGINNMGQQGTQYPGVGGKGFTQYPLLNPIQQRLQNLINLMAGQQLTGPSNAPDISALENQAKQEFQSETVPSIAQRFTGATRGSDFAGRLGAAGAGLESQLANLRYQHGLQQQGIQESRLGQLLNYGLAPQQQTVANQPEPIDRSPGIGEQFARAAGQYGPQLIMELLKQYFGQQGGGGGNRFGGGTSEPTGDYSYAAGNVNYNQL